jgi:serine/threonine-protein kinase
MNLKLSITVIAVLSGALGCATSQTPKLTPEMIEGSFALRTPPGWILRGNAPEEYQVFTDIGVKYSEMLSVSLVSTTASNNDFASFLQKITADNYVGKRLRFSAFLRCNRVHWASLWMRVDSKGAAGVAFDNMDDRRVKGTTDWLRYSIVLDIPKDANVISFGAMLGGTGQLWIDGCVLEIVGKDVGVTRYNVKGVQMKVPGREGLLNHPTNMGFESR